MGFRLQAENDSELGWDEDREGYLLDYKGHG